MNEKISRTQQDYIKAIWNLSQSERKVKMKTVADILGIKSPSVVVMFKELERIGLISYDKKNGAQLSEKGKEEAERIIRKHRLIETFLQRVLQIDEPLLHDEAEKLIKFGNKLLEERSRIRNKLTKFEL